MELITSVRNPRVKSLLALREHRERKQRAMMLVEGFDEVLLAVTNGFKPLEVYYTPSLARAKPEGEILRHTVGVPTFELSPEVFAKVAYREKPDGWLVVMAMPHKGLFHLILSPQPLLLVAEAVEKPGNLGAMLRTADAAGVDAVIACDALTDWGNPNIVRASKGTLFTVQVVDARSESAIHWLTDMMNIQIVAAVPEADLPYTEVDFTLPTAIVMGTEHAGLSPLWREAAHVHTTIPMFGKINSLNVSASAALLMYEAVRQRNRLKG